MCHRPVEISFFWTQTIRPSCLPLGQALLPSQFHGWESHPTDVPVSTPPSDTPTRWIFLKLSHQAPLRRKHLEALCCLTIQVQMPELSFQSLLKWPHPTWPILFSSASWHTPSSLGMSVSFTSHKHAIFILLSLRFVHVAPQAWNAASGPRHRNIWLYAITGFLVCHLKCLYMHEKQIPFP